ncbi:MAG: MFS transporter [Holosporales bacterium]|jgi:MFS family permease|nr:MFS transporter [Holosporales bacterium]
MSNLKEEDCEQKKIPITVWQIGFMMLLMNISFVMIYSFAGLYLKKILGASVLGVGIVEGLSETMSHIMKLVSGILSDFFHKRKNIIVIGYVFSVLSKLLLAISSSFAMVFTNRLTERLGNGIQASPRDAIVADVAPRKKIGASYGLKRTLAYTGSLLGGFCGIVTMHLSNNNYQMVFAVASVPSIVAFAILIFCIKEPKKYNHQAMASEAPMPKPKVEQKFSISNFKYLGTSFWLLMCVNAVFMMSRMSETFLILYAHDNFGIIEKFAPVVMIILNIGTSFISYPIGFLGDKFNRVKILFLGIAFLVFADIVMFSASTIVSLGIGIFLWGAQLGATQNVFVSLIAEKVPEDLRGTGFGVYWLFNAIFAFIADSIAGYVGNNVSVRNVFISSGMIGLGALIVLALFMNDISPARRRSL